MLTNTVTCIKFRFALNLKYLSSSAYRAVRQSGVINLPSERTLVDYTHWSSPHSGVQLEFIEKFLTMLNDHAPSGHNHCTLSMDEMKIKSGLVFSMKDGNLVGFIDLGTVNRDIEQLMSGSVERKMADHVFAFMVRAVFKPSLSAPIAHYFSSNLKGVHPIILCLYSYYHMNTSDISSSLGGSPSPGDVPYPSCESHKRWC